jgi:hypothetical protein
MDARACAAAVVATAAAACVRGTPDAGSWDVPVAGSWQKYRATRGADPPFTYRIAVVAVSAAGFTRRATVPGQPNALESTYVVLDGSEFVEGVTTYASDGSVVGTTAYDPPFPVLSANDDRGHTTAVTSTVSSDGSPSSSSTRTVEVDGVETVAVPAGVFEGLRTTARITSSAAGESWNVVWWARGVGRVKMRAWETSNPGGGTTYELAAHGIDVLP